MEIATNGLELRRIVYDRLDQARPGSPAGPSCSVHQESCNGIEQFLRLITAERMSAVFEDAQIGIGNQPMHLFRKLRCALPIMAARQDQRGRGDATQLRTQVERPEEPLRAMRAIDRFR